MTEHINLASGIRERIEFAICPNLSHTFADGHDQCEETMRRVLPVVAEVITTERAQVGGEYWRRMAKRPATLDDEEPTP